MGIGQIWERDGCPTNEATLRKIIKEYRENGVQGLQSCETLEDYVRKLSDKQIAFMLEEDKVATLQILVDTLRVEEAFEKVCGLYAETFATKLVEMGWSNPANRYLKKKENNNTLKLIEAQREKDRLEEQNKELQFQILALKAKLYDTYEAINDPTEKRQQKGELQPCRETEKTPSGSLE